MSGSVAEALLASGSKKLPLLPPPPKLKKEPKTFTFDLELAESNEKTYPEFSWTELVRNAKQKELTKKASSGTPTLNPYASDDEEDLKAMAAKFEAKYNNTAGTTKKKKRRVEDYIDKGAGYDETDPFIDNSDVYDEVVPADLQTAHGGFYINSGSLDFKEVELSEDEEDSLSQPPKVPKIKKAKTKIGVGLLPKQKNPVGRPPGVGNKRPIPVDKLGLSKKRKIAIGPEGKPISKLKKINTINKSEKINEVTPGKPKTVQLSSSSASSSSSSSEESSSSESESSSSEETEEKKESKETPKLKPPAPIKVKATITSSMQPKPIPNVNRQPDTKVLTTVVHGGPPPQKRLKTKNVPLNPKLHPNLAATVMTSSSSTVSINVTPPQQMQSKMLNKDLIKANGGGNVNISPRTQSPSGIMPMPTTSPALKVPPPKPVSTPMISSGVTISPVNSQAPKNSNHLPAKPKMKNKPAASGINVPPAHLDIFNTIASYTGLPNLNNFAPNLTPNSSLLKAGMSMVGAPKAMPNLKKMTQPSSGEKLVHKQPKAAVQHNKPVKPKPKPVSNTPINPPTSHTSAFNSGGSSTYLSTTYKTPPPLAGPGVEISKVRTSSVINSGVNSNPKVASSTTQFSPSSLSLATVSLAHTSNNSNSLTSNALLSAAGITSILNSSPNSLVSNVPSSLTVQRLPQSITITPTSNQSVYPIGGMTAGNTSLSMDTKASKHSTSFTMSSLLQNPTVNYAAHLMGSSKSGAGKSNSNLANNRDLQRK